MPNLFFDFDGTIADSEQGIVNSLKYTVAQLKLKELTESEYRTFIGPPIIESLHVHYPELNNEQLNVIAKVYHEHYITEGKFDLVVFDEFETTLQQLQAMNYKIYTASAKPVEVLTEILNHFDLSHYFDGIYGATATLPAKTEILAYAMQDTDATTNDSVMIGDTMSDITGGKNNLVKTLGVTYGFGEVTGADIIVDAPTEIVKAVQELFS